MPNIKMKRVENPNPKTQSIMRLGADIPLFNGKGDLNYVCSSCQKILLKNLENAQQFPNLVVGCFTCGSVSEMP